MYVGVVANGMKIGDRALAPPRRYIVVVGGGWWVVTALVVGLRF